VHNLLPLRNAHAKHRYADFGVIPASTRPATSVASSRTLCFGAADTLAEVIVVDDASTDGTAGKSRP